MKIEIEKVTVNAPARKLKGTWTIDYGYEFKTMTYKERLIQLHNQKLQYRDLSRRDYHGHVDSDEEIIKTITEKMQHEWPGPYIVEEYFDSKRMSFALRLKFNSPQEETLWMIKNS